MIDPSKHDGYIPPWMDRMRPHIGDAARHLYACPNRRGMSKRMQRLWLKHVNQSSPTLTFESIAGWLDRTAMWRWRANVARRA